MTSFEQSTAVVAVTKKEREPHIQRLLDMLTYRRPAGTNIEERFLKRFIYPLDVQQDKYGNVVKRIGDAPIMWSCHTDTVHRNGGRQRISITGDKVVTFDPQSNCLGADCTAGVWLMTEMIKAEVPGLYVFHRAEERGGKGSEFLVANHPDLFEGIKFAIAFDRRGTGSIISHQWSGRCCSDEFITSLSNALGMGHIKDSGGTFTDTANYVDLIGECTNVSVGYKDEHQATESLDLAYIDRLRWALLSGDFTDLVAKRQPGEVEDYWDDWEYYRGYGYLRDDAYGYRSGLTPGRNTAWSWGEDQEPSSNTNRTIASLVREHYDEVADWLEEEGMDAKTLAHIIYARGGAVRM